MLDLPPTARSITDLGDTETESEREKRRRRMLYEILAPVDDATRLKRILDDVNWVACRLDPHNPYWDCFRPDDAERDADGFPIDLGPPTLNAWLRHALHIVAEEESQLYHLLEIAIERLKLLHAVHAQAKTSLDENLEEKYDEVRICADRELSEIRNEVQRLQTLRQQFPALSNNTERLIKRILGAVNYVQRALDNGEPVSLERHSAMRAHQQNDEDALLPALGAHILDALKFAAPVSSRVHQMLETVLIRLDIISTAELQRHADAQNHASWTEIIEPARLQVTRDLSEIHEEVERLLHEASR
jgi:molecular chaperone GrpE (heat shock protein)